MSDTTKKRQRKPRDFLSKARLGFPSIFISDTEDSVEIFGGILEMQDCRKLSAWLLRAADYLEQQEGRGDE